VPDAIVTGCAGFIGSHLTERLLERGDRVLGIDSFDDYYPPEMKRRNLTTALTHRRFQFLRANVRQVRLRRHLDPEVRVIHLAAQPGVRGSWGSKFSRYVQNNVLATQSVLETLASAGSPGRFVYASSSSIYGETPEGATPEDTPARPVSPYGMTKLSGEHLVRLYARAHGLSAVSLRFFSVYGPRQRPDMAFHKFFRAAQAGTSIDVYGDGRQSRDFTFVGDIVAGILAAADSDTDAGVFNLGAGTPQPLARAVDLIGRTSGARIRVRHLPEQLGDPRATWADIRRARRLLGFRPRVSLEEGLAQQWEWHSTELKGVPIAA
jgi:nucleoside-diphosphate-sugar epimerase